MTPSLSIIIASHNDPDQTALTVASIRETSPPHVEIIVVDDCSATPLMHYVRPNEQTKLVVNRFRCGCGPSRHIGAMKASGDWLLIVDSHMRFVPGWYDEWTKANRAVPLDEVFKTLFCATCLGLDSKHMDPLDPVAEYHGATMNVYGPDRVDPKHPMQVFEAVWLPNKPEPEDGQELAAIMGACYILSREWFFHLSALRFLRMWGGDEQALSIASWLAGGIVRLAKNVKIGHKFLLAGKERQNYPVPPGDVVYNKLALINSMLPQELAAKLSQLLFSHTALREAEVTRRLYREEYFLVAQEKARYESIFTRPFEWYCDRFKIPVP